MAGPTLDIGLNPRDAIFALARLTAASRQARVAVLGVVGAVVGIASVGTATALQMMKVAGAAEEIHNKFNAVFKGDAGRISDELERIGAAAGRSQVELRAMAAGTQDILVPLGLVREQASSLSAVLTETAVDLASFQDKLDPVVAQAFESALVGNVRALRIYGINLKAVEVENKALELGLAETRREISEQDRVYARAILILENTKDAMGDAEITADSYQNTLKRLKGELHDISAAVGGGLTQAFRTAINETVGFDVVILRLEDALTLVGDAGQRVIDTLADLGVLAGSESDIFQTRLAQRNLQRFSALGVITDEEADVLFKGIIDAGTKAAQDIRKQRKQVEQDFEKWQENVASKSSFLKTMFGAGVPHAERMQWVKEIERLSDEATVAAARNTAVKETRLKVIGGLEDRAIVQLLMRTEETAKKAGGEIEAAYSTALQRLKDLAGEGGSLVDLSLSRVMKELAPVIRDTEYLERLEATLKIIDEYKKNQQEDAPVPTADEIRLRFIENNRLGLAALKSGVSEFSNAIGQAAVNLGQFEDIAKNAFYGVVQAIATASAELLAFKALAGLNVSDQLLNQLGYYPQFVGENSADPGASTRQKVTK